MLLYIRKIRLFASNEFNEFKIFCAISFHALRKPNPPKKVFFFGSH